MPWNCLGSCRWRKKQIRFGLGGGPGRTCGQAAEMQVGSRNSEAPLGFWTEGPNGHRVTEVVLGDPQSQA